MQIKAGRHDSTKYDLLREGHRFPPKVVISRAAFIEHGLELPESDFSRGTSGGQANTVLKELGFVIVPKSTASVRLPLELSRRYGRQDVYATVGVHYHQTQCYLNVGLSPQ
jgi:hypothetical protein